jgi:hypothetical protein
MPSYQVTASELVADGKTEFFACHEFEAVDTAAAMAAADAWFRSKGAVAPRPASIRLYAGKVLLCERAAPGGAWKK